MAPLNPVGERNDVVVESEAPLALPSPVVSRSFVSACTNGDGVGAVMPSQTSTTFSEVHLQDLTPALVTTATKVSSHMSVLGGGTSSLSNTATSHLR